MINQCTLCLWTYDDEFRLTICPHELFPANDGKNNFIVHNESLIYCPHGFEDGYDCLDCDTGGERS